MGSQKSACGKWKGSALLKQFLLSLRNMASSAVSTEVRLTVSLSRAQPLSSKLRAQL